jgi:ribosomal protein S18 acetylase RimI-like enzyme
MSVSAAVQVRPAVLTDQRQIANLINLSSNLHRHLDWRSPLDWIGAPPFFVLENQGQVSAALACPPDPPSIAWIRLFVSNAPMPVIEAWQTLWDAARVELSRRGSFITAAIVLSDWYGDLLISSGFTTHQSIVMLARDGPGSIDLQLPPGVSIRSMMLYDLPAVADVDASAFDVLWQNTLPSLEKAYPQAVLATVAETNEQVVGYQISTRTPFGAHLARLAVRPALQGSGLGRALVAELIQQSERRGMFRLTVNTQSDNAISLALYNKVGFRETGERYPVYQLQVS